MKKFTLLTFETYKPNLLKELQKFGDVHFKNLQQDDLIDLKVFSKDSSTDKISRYEAQLEKIKFCMTKLEPYFDKPKGVKALTTPLKTLAFDEFDAYADSYDYEVVFDTVKAEDERINTAKTEIIRLKAENEGLRTWLKLDVSLQELEKQRFVKYLIGSVSKVASESFRMNVEDKFKTAYVEYLGNVKDDVTVLIIIPSPEFEEALTYFKTLGFSRLPLSFIGVPAGIISTNNDEISKLQKAQIDAGEKIKKMASEYEKLQIVFDCLETVLEREKACQNFLKMQTVFLVEGWVPAEDSAGLNELVTKTCGNDYYLEAEDVEKDCEEVPIKLKNNKMVAAFEDVTAMFSMPKYNEIDPTPVMMPFYFIFFGLMLGDAGYGLLLVVATTIAIRFFALKEGMKKFLQFFFYLGIATILGGTVYGSMFGFPFFTPIAVGDGTYKAILDSQADVMTMMIVSVAIGFVQVLFGIGVKGYMLLRDGKVFAAIFDSLFLIITVSAAIGWLLCAFLGIQGTAITISGWAFLAGVLGLVATQGRESPTMVGKIASGLYSVYGLTSYVGDLVSYTRIAALALSGAYIAYSFNLMAGLMPSGIFRIIFGGIIFVIGQALNVGLSALGAYVHTCRLQYVEYFGKFYEGGGVPFNAFKLKNKFINIKK